MVNRMKRQVLVGSFILSLGTGVLLLILAVRSIAMSLEAERTLGAYLLVLSVLTSYTSQNQGRWPQSWEDLATVHVVDHYGSWEWPRDIVKIRQRIRIDFAITAKELAAIESSEFKFVEQVGPNYGPRESQIRELLEAIRRFPLRPAQNPKSDDGGPQRKDLSTMSWMDG